MAQPGTPNLNNEVVKMRKEVKRVRVLVIRKLVRSVSRLKSKKGTEDALLKNQRRAQRLLEEIHAMKVRTYMETPYDCFMENWLLVKQDAKLSEFITLVQCHIIFIPLCLLFNLQHDSTATERAVARLAVHPLLKKKIDVLKATVKAFKDARQNVAEVKSSKNVSEENHSKDTLCSNDDTSKVQHEGTIISDQKEKEAKLLAKKPIHSKAKISKMEHEPKAVDIPVSPPKPSEKDPVVPSEPQKIPADRKGKMLRKTKKKGESDNSCSSSSDGKELHEEEREYFDDSTEERFYKQSSMSEESDSGDDFFIGKVRRTRKKESSFHASAEEQKTIQKVLPEEDIFETQRGIKNDKNKPNTETRKFESVFFHSLSGSKSSRRNYREQAPKSKTSGFQKNEPQIKNQFSRSAQRGLDSTKQQPQLPLHPSWEASRRRKEQQSKIALFQGKKITFDD
nr:serum response factor-binding protein 1 [Manis javanica]